MKLPKKGPLFFMALLCLSISVKAQYAGFSPTIPSPNAASLGLYTELPVSYFTGVPEISVPLYMIQGKHLSLPITLDYNASGLRPEVHPGWVGNGWSLSAGGVITRKANGLIDEYNRPAIGAQGYYFNYANLQTSNNWLTKTTTYVNTGVEFYGQNCSYNYNDGLDADEQPDEFDFNFLGYSGKFFLDQNGKWQVQCDKNLTVSFQSSDLIYPFVYYQPYVGGCTNMSRTFGKFTLTDEAGNQYIFGELNTANATTDYNTAIEYSDAMYPNGTLTSSLTATSWYLAEIISADKTETINLSYERGPLESYIGGGFSANSGSGTVPGGFGFSSFSCSSPGGNSGYSGTLIFPVYLTKITMPTQDLEIDFNKSASNELTYPSGAGAYSYPIPSSGPGSSYSSDNAYIVEYADAGGSLQPYPPDFPSDYLQDFTSSNMIPYFGLPNTLPTQQDQYIGWANRCIWLKCDGFTVNNTSSLKTEKTVSFTYNNIPTKRLQLESLSINDGNSQPVQNYSFSYNNGTPLPAYLSSNTDSWGFNNNNTTYVNTSNVAAVRAVDATGVQTQADILTAITYPTGGTTQFRYQPNTYGAYIDRSLGVNPITGGIGGGPGGIAGGLRIDSIISTDVNGNSLTKSYYYVSGYSPSVNPATLPSSGVLDSKPIYSFTITGKDLNNKSFSYQATSSNPVVPLTSSSTGTHIGYSQVAEVLSDGSYNIYKFTNEDNTSGYTDVAPLATFYPNAMDYYYSTSLAYERGKLLNKSSYNNAGLLAASETTGYTNNVTTYGSPAPTFAANVVASSAITVCSESNDGAVSRTAFQLDYAPFVPYIDTKTGYDLNGNIATTTTTNSTYDQYKNLVEQDMTNSDGNVEKVRYLYPYNFSTTATTNPYTIMTAQNMNNVVIEKINSVITAGTEYVTGGEVHTYQLYAGSSQLVNDAVYNFESVSPVAYSSKAASYYLGSSTPGQLSLDSHYVLRQTLYYDANMNVSSTLDNSGHVNAYLWDYNGSDPVAKVTNASNIYSSLYSSTVKNDIAYNSFEYLSIYDMDKGTGNWSGIAIGNIIPGGALAGHNYYSLSLPGGSSAPLVSGALNPAQTYIVSYWSMNGPYTVSGSQSTITGTSLPTITSPVWTYYQHTVTGVSSVSVSGTGGIDELRLYPQGAQMSTYTWEPMVGLKGTSNEKSQFTYDAYDAFERLSYTSDQTGSITKAYAYNYAVSAALTQPEITSVSSSGGVITVNFISIASCNSAELNYTDVTAGGATNHDNSNCSSPFVLGGLTEGHTYQVSISCYSNTYPSGVTSSTQNVTIN